MLAVGRGDFQGNQAGHRDHNAGDTPEPTAKPHGQKHEYGVEIQPPSDQQGLHHLALEGGEREVAADHAEHVPQVVEGNQRHDREQHQGRSRAHVGNEIQHRGDRTPQVGIGNTEQEHGHRRGGTQSQVDEGDDAVITPQLATHGVDNPQRVYGLQIRPQRGRHPGQHRWAAGKQEHSEDHYGDDLG